MHGFWTDAERALFFEVVIVGSHRVQSAVVPREHFPFNYNVMQDIELELVSLLVDDLWLKVLVSWHLLQEP